MAKGADPNVKDTSGLSVLRYAEEGARGDLIIMGRDRGSAPRPRGDGIDIVRFSSSRISSIALRQRLS